MTDQRPNIEFQIILGAIAGGILAYILYHYDLLSIYSALSVLELN